MDLLDLPTSFDEYVQPFTAGLVVEIFTDDGLVGIGNAALAPQICKEVIDLYLKPRLNRSESLGHRIPVAAHVPQDDGVGRKGIGMTAISAVDIALWDLLGNRRKQPVYSLLGGRTKQRIPVYASRLYSAPLSELPPKPKVPRRRLQSDEVALRLGTHRRCAGMQRNVELVRTVRDAVGNEIDVMADAYMGWTLDYAKRMLPLLEPFNLRWLEEAVIPDDIHGYAELKSYGRVPIAGGEHEFTLYGSATFSKLAPSTTFSLTRIGRWNLASAENRGTGRGVLRPVIPHAGQMHNFHVVMASLNSPMAEYFPIVDVEVGNELFWYIFNGEPKARTATSILMKACQAWA
jgi:L-alanine-DL-glutamate epimerase-like enolase superfamily enzyme